MSNFRLLGHKKQESRTVEKYGLFELYPVQQPDGPTKPSKAEIE